MGYSGQQLSTAACEMLCAYNWPGNVRELENIIERAIVLSRGGKIDEEHLPNEIIAEATKPVKLEENYGNNLEQCVADLETRMINKALQDAEGNKAKAARSLEISERTLWYKLKKYKINFANPEE